MDSGTLQALELIGWGVLMYWLLTVNKSARKTADEAGEKSAVPRTDAKSDDA